MGSKRRDSTNCSYVDPESTMLSVSCQSPSERCRDRTLREPMIKAVIDREYINTMSVSTISDDIVSGVRKISSCRQLTDGNLVKNGTTRLLPLPKVI